MPRIRFTIFLLLIAALSMSGRAFAGQEIKTVDTRPGVTVKVLLATPAKESRKVLVMFPGGRGNNQFGEKSGRIRLGRNFLVRTTPSFVEKGLAVAVVDVPSDHRQGMDDDFRASSRHQEDIDKVLLFLAAQGYESMYLVGTSKGTISVAYLAGTLQNDRIKGVVLTSSMSYNRFLRWLPLDQVRYPVLIVHHKNDGCPHCPYSEALGLKEKLPGSPRVDFIPVEGGEPPRSGPCNALSAHGYLGVEDHAVQAICDWVK